MPRCLLYRLFRQVNPVSLPSVADCVTEWEVRVPAEERPDERLRVYMSLYHDHLPVPEEAGVVAYCQTEDMVALTAAADGLEPHLRRTAERDLPQADPEW